LCQLSGSPTIASNAVEGVDFMVQHCLGYLERTYTIVY
jgi:hypothetical protein